MNFLLCINDAACCRFWLHLCQTFNIRSIINELPEDLMQTYSFLSCVLPEERLNRDIHSLSTRHYIHGCTHLPNVSNFLLMAIQWLPQRCQGLIAMLEGTHTGGVHYLITFLPWIFPNSYSPPCTSPPLLRIVEKVVPFQQCVRLLNRLGLVARQH